MKDMWRLKLSRQNLRLKHGRTSTTKRACYIDSWTQVCSGTKLNCNKTNRSIQKYCLYSLYSIAQARHRIEQSSSTKWSMRVIPQVASLQLLTRTCSESSINFATWPHMTWWKSAARLKSSLSSITMTNSNPCEKLSTPSGRNNSWSPSTGQGHDSKTKSGYIKSLTKSRKSWAQRTCVQKCFKRHRLTRYTLNE